MLKNHDPVLGGLLMVPLVKFRLFDTDLDTTITNVESQVNRVNEHLQKWKSLLSKMNYDWHSVRISHTDQDMLTIAFQIKFLKPTPLENKALLEELFDTLENLQKSELL
jgi:transcription termination factor NusB